MVPSCGKTNGIHKAQVKNFFHEYINDLLDILDHLRGLTHHTGFFHFSKCFRFFYIGKDDLEKSWFENCETVGISAGASTPDDIIRNVVEKIKEIGHVSEEEIVYE